MKSEHLAEGIRPIMACIGTLKEYGKELSAIEGIEEVGHDIDWKLDEKELNEKGFDNGGEETYVFSPIDSKPKATKMVWNCTSLVAVGRDASSGAEISFLTHQWPGKFLKSGRFSFFRDLERQLLRLKVECQPGSVDVVIAGGNLREDGEEYQKSLEMLTTITREALGFKPSVISGPKNFDGDEIYLDTENRRLYVIRPEGKGVVLYNDVFDPDEVGEKIKKWTEKKTEPKSKDGLEDDNN